MTLYRNEGMYIIAEALSERKKDYSFDTYVEYFLKTFLFLDKIASIFVEELTQMPGISEAPEDEKIVTFAIGISKFMNFPCTSDTPSREEHNLVCSSDLFDIIQEITGVGYTETEEIREFVFLAPKCHNLRDAFSFFVDLQE